MKALLHRHAHALLLLAAVALAYANALSGPFQFDDFEVIVESTPVHSFGSWWADLGHGLRPLLKLSYLFNWLLGEGAPFGFRLFNVCIHAGNVLLLRALAMRAAAAWLPQLPSEQQQRAAFCVALIFTLHPASTEAVTYICARSTSLMTLCFLAALLAHLRGWLAVAFLAFIAALAVKEPAATLPLTLWLADRHGLRSYAGARHLAWRRYVPYALLLITIVLIVVPRTNYRGFLLGGLAARDLGDNLLSQIDAVWDLLKLALLLRAPNIDPDLPLTDAFTPLLALKLLALIAAFLLVLKQRHARPWLSFGALWFVLQLLPTNSLLPRNDLVNDRQLYLAGMGLWLALSFDLCARGAFASPLRSGIALVLIAAGLIALTHTRNDDYRSEIALWRATVQASPLKSRPWNNLGYAYQIAGCPASAVAAYERALSLASPDERAANNLRALRYALGASARDGAGCASLNQSR